MSAFLKKIINKSQRDDIVIDFKNIKFISRSCVAEYLKLKEETDKNLIEMHMSDEIKSMFSLVVNQSKSNNFIFTKKVRVIN